MRIFFLLFLFIALALSSFGQADTTRRLYKDDYLQKSKNQKKTGNILLGVGGGLILTAFVIPKGEKIQDGICIPFVWCEGDEYKNDELKAIIGLVGTATALSSIPFYKAARKNARKATTVGLHMQRAVQLSNRSMVQHSFPALQIRWCF
jgi:hypothetical protein